MNIEKYLHWHCGFCGFSRGPSKKSSLKLRPGRSLHLSLGMFCQRVPVEVLSSQPGPVQVENAPAFSTAETPERRRARPEKTVRVEESCILECLKGCFMIVVDGDAEGSEDGCSILKYSFSQALYFKFIKSVICILENNGLYRTKTTNVSPARLSQRLTEDCHSIATSHRKTF